VRVTDSRSAESTNPATQVITVDTTLSGVFSRKTHGTSGTFDISLPTEGPVGVECRNDGSNSHTVVFTFQRNLTTVTSSAVSEGTATKGAEGIGPNQNQYSVSLTGVTDDQYVTVTLDGVQDTAGANLTRVQGRMAVVNGDTSGNRSVNTTDIGQAKAQSGQTVTLKNFRLDVSVNGNFINSTDISQIKANSGATLP